MRGFIKITFLILYMAVAFFAFGLSIDVVPFHLSDLITALFAAGGVAFWAELDAVYLFKFIDWIKGRNKKIEK
jgi:hypothetical protein